MKENELLEEYELLETTLKNNIEVMQICKLSNNKNKNTIILSVFKELKVLCESIIPIYEDRIELYTKD